MKDINELIRIVKIYNKQILTTKTLHDLGISNYYINKLIDLCGIERVKRGQYKINFSKDEKQILKDQVYKLLYRFNHRIENHEFKSAYYLLQELNNRELDQYINSHVHICFDLLNKILGENYPHKNREDMYIRADIDESNYYIYLEEFKQNLFENNLKEANVAFLKFQEEEFKARGLNTDATMTIRILMDEVYKVRSKENEDRRRATRAFNNFKASLELKDYESALQYIKENGLYVKGSFLDNSKNIQNLLETILACKRGYILEDKGLDYSYSNRPMDVFYKALANRDYLVAYKNIGIITYQNDSQILNIYKKLLHELISINKQNNKQSGNNSSLRKDEKDNNELNDQLLSAMVFNKEYDKLKTLLREKKDKGLRLSRLECHTLYILNGRDRVISGNYIPPKYISRHPEYNHFGRFFEAVKMNDYEVALQYLNDIIYSATPVYEFKVYKHLLEDVTISIERNKTYQIVKNEINEINKQLDRIIKTNETMLSTEDIDTIEKLIEEKCQLLMEIDADWSIEQNILNIITIIRLAKEHFLTREYFEDLKIKANDVVTQFNYCLYNGDFVSAYELLKNNGWKSLAASYSDSDLRLMRFLLTNLINILNANDNIQVCKEEVVESVDSIDRLKEIARLIKKKRDFNAAFTYLLDNDFDDIDENLYCDIAANLAFLRANHEYLEYNSFLNASLEQDIKEKTLLP